MYLLKLVKGEMDRNNEYLSLYNGPRDKAVEILNSLKDPHHILDALECLRDLQRKEEKKEVAEESTDLSMEVLMEKYVDSLHSLRESSITQYRREAEKFIDYLAANSIRVVDIDIDIYSKYISVRSVSKDGKKLALNSKAKIINILRRFLDFLVSRKYININTKEVRSKRIKKPREYVCKSDLEKIIYCIDTRPERFKHENLIYKVMVYLIIDLGARRGEIIKLDWKHIEFDKSLVRLVDTKGGKERKIKIGPNLAKLLKYYQKALGFYKGALVRGVQNKKRITRSALQNIKTKLIKEAGITTPGLCLHSFRHTHITEVHRIAGPIIAKENAGHESVESTDGYVHLSEEDMDKAIIDIPLHLSSSDENN